MLSPLLSLLEKTVYHYVNWATVVTFKQWAFCCLHRFRLLQGLHAFVSDESGKAHASNAWITKLYLYIMVKIDKSIINCPPDNSYVNVNCECVLYHMKKYISEIE